MNNKFALIDRLEQCSDEVLKRSPKLVVELLSVLNRTGYDNSIDQYIKKRLHIFPNLTFEKKVTKYDVVSFKSLIFDTSEKLSFSSDAEQYLDIHAIKTLGELRHFTEQELLDLQFPKQIVVHINSVLQQKGYCLYGTKTKSKK